MDFGQTINMNDDLQPAFLEMRNITKTFQVFARLMASVWICKRVRFTRWLAKMALVSLP